MQAARACDPYYGLRRALGEIADGTAEWAGLPMPLDGQRLIVEPSYPWAEALGRIGAQIGDDGEPIGDRADGWVLRNRWYSRSWRCDVFLMEKDGRIDWGRLPAFHHISHDLNTLGCSEAWGLEQERAALDLLGQMVRHRQLKQYLLTGMFLERSKRSGVTYLFRKNKPTVAIAARPGLPDAAHGMTILCSLCMHPIAYYAGSWAGAMCPTDDVIAHLAMMRGDEAMFWKRCSQHPPYRPEAGL